ncbi:hypothetical protein [Novipirellula sp.]|uniref:hypothetical protein n=1 Tax=Novipirellula sp. TaxID=2795430 RepID=UPI00356B0EB3
MNHWPSSRWKIAYSKGLSHDWIEPSLPFALIGSHEACTLSLGESRIPSAVYLACAFADGIEVWPLCAISFPRWGILLPQEELLVGRTAITFSQQDVNPPPGPSSAEVDSATSNRFRPNGQPSSDSRVGRGTFDVGERQHPYPKLVLSMDGESRTKTLRRRVTILGSRHPSTFRVHGLRLSPYDHAIIAVNDSVWLIDLKCPEGLAQEEWVTRLVPGGDPVAIGNMNVQLQAIEGATDGATDDITADLGNERNPLGGEAGESMLLSVREDRKRPPAKTAAKSLPSRVAHKPIVNEVVEDVQDRSLVDDDEDDDELATRITDRLVSIQQRKTLRRRLVAMVAYGSAFLVAIFSITWIVVRLLIPAFADAS